MDTLAGLVYFHVRQPIRQTAAGVQEPARRRQTLGREHGERPARNSHGAAGSRRQLQSCQAADREHQAEGRGRGSAQRAVPFPAGGQDRSRRADQDPGQPRVQAALCQRTAQRVPDRGTAGLGQDDLDGQAGALAFEERPHAHDGIGGRVPSGGARAVEGSGARRQANRSTRARPARPRRSTWHVRRAGKASIGAATSCSWTRRAACISTTT